MAPKKEKVSVDELFSRLKVFSEKDEHEGVLDCATRILSQDPSSKEALKSRFIALIKLDKFNEAYQASKESAFESLLRELIVPYAYTLYKLEKYEELPKLESDDRGFQHVLAQAYYKAEEFVKANDIYAKLISGDSQVNSEHFDLAVNKSAIEAQLLLNGLESEISEPKNDSYDQVFNVATSYIGIGDYDKALELLSEAKLICENSLSADDASSEVVPILVQAAYVRQVTGKNDEAISILENLGLPKKIADDVVHHVAINNMLSLDSAKAENPHYALRLLSTGDSPASTSRQIKLQRVLLGYNKLTLQNLAGRNIKHSAKKYIRQFPERMGVESISQLSSIQDPLLSNKVGKLYGTEPQSLSIAFALAQLYVNENSIDSAANTLETVFNELKSPEKYYPGLVGSLVSLFRLQGRDQAAVKIMSEALQVWSRDVKLQNQSELMQVAAVALADNESWKSVAHEEFEKLYASSPDNATNAAGILATSSEEVAKENRDLLSKLKSVDHFISNTDVEALDESGIQPLLRKPAISSMGHGKVMKKVRKRKPSLPKDYDESKTPDPERWLPKRDRSTWKPKKKKDKKNIKATQGGLADNTTESGISSKPTSAGVKSSNKKSKKKSKK